MTAILNDTAQTATFFSGTNAPTSGTGFRSFESMPLRGDTAYCLGGANGGQQMIGTMKSLRYYNRALSDEEVARNRVVDEFRYFGRSPVTNVLVAATCPYLQGNEKAAAYEVVGSYTFTAPPVRHGEGHHLHQRRLHGRDVGRFRMGQRRLL